MRITVDIDAALLEEAMKITGEKKKGPAIAKAASEFIKRQKAKLFGSLLMEGYFDYPSTPEEIADLDG